MLSFAAAAQFNVPKFTSDAMDVITNPKVDAVWICSPSQYHADQIKACAANKKHVFCEKPIATDLPETVEAINACGNDAGVKLMIGLQRRFDQNFMHVQESVAQRQQPTTITATVAGGDKDEDEEGNKSSGEEEAMKSKTKMANRAAVL